MMSSFPPSFPSVSPSVQPTEASAVYADKGSEIGLLVQEKNEAYGDSFARAGDIMEILYPDGIMPSQYRDALGVVRVIDKLFRIATRKEAFGESPWNDIGGYGVLGAVADAAAAPVSPLPLPPKVPEDLAAPYHDTIPSVEAPKSPAVRQYRVCVTKAGSTTYTAWDNFPDALDQWTKCGTIPGCLIELLSPAGFVLESKAS